MTGPAVAPATCQPVLAYDGDYDHLADELAWLDRLLQMRVAAFRRRARSATDPSPLYIAHAEVDALLEGNNAVAPEPPEPPEPRARLAELRYAIEARVAASLARGRDLPLARLGRIFALSPFELDVLLICLAPELDRKYDRLYAYLQDDITRRKPSVDLALGLLCETPAERWRARAHFAAQAPLFRYGLLQATDDPQSPAGSSDLARFLKLDPRIAGFLLGDHRIDGRLAGIARLEWPDPSAPPPLLDPALVERTLRLVMRYCAPGVAGRVPLALYLCGPPGIGRRELALAICGQLPCPLFCVDLECLLARGGEFETLLRLAFREGPLCQAALYFDNLDPLLAEDERARVALKRLASAAADYGWLLFLAGTRPWLPGGLLGEIAFQRIELPVADVSLREEAWRRALARLESPVEPIWANELARRFRLTPGQIRAAAENAGRQGVMDGSAAELTLAGLGAACRHQSSQKLAELARKIEPRAGWDDLVLPADRLEQLRELCGQVRAARPGVRGLGLRAQAGPWTWGERALLRLARHRQDPGRRGDRRRAGAGPVPDRPVAGGQQIHRRDREESGAPLPGGRDQQRHSVLR